jgi:hypothetical protein
VESNVSHSQSSQRGGKYRENPEFSILRVQSGPNKSTGATPLISATLYLFQNLSIAKLSYPERGIKFGWM